MSATSLRRVGTRRTPAPGPMPSLQDCCSPSKHLRLSSDGDLATATTRRHVRMCHPAPQHHESEVHETCSPKPTLGKRGSLQQATSSEEPDAKRPCMNASDSDLSGVPSPESTVLSSPPPGDDEDSKVDFLVRIERAEVDLPDTAGGQVTTSVTEDRPVTRSGKVLQAYAPKSKPRDARKSAQRSEGSRLQMILAGHADLSTLGLAQDAEDLYFAKLALERLRTLKPSPKCFQSAARVLEELETEEEEVEDVHDNGCSRAQGMMRITPRAKVFHVASRQEEKTTPHSSTLGMGALARQARAAEASRLEEEGDMSLSGAGGAGGDLMRTRKKALKFAKSRIHDWGLYALEPIAPRQMVIEYVGELVRAQVANERETRYERSGQFSTYLFRVDDDLVVDATCRGNTARLMNHCCRPNCTANIVTINGQKRIVVYAKEWILPGAELTYDYKLAHSSDEEPMPCLCGVEGCRRFL